MRIRFNQKKAKYDHIARANGLTFIPAIFSHTGQIHDTIKGWMFNQIKMKMELHDPQVQSDKIKSVMRYWTGQLSAVINKTASRAILAVAANLVDKVNSVIQHRRQLHLRTNARTLWMLIKKMLNVSWKIWNYWC